VAENGTTHTVSASAPTRVACVALLQAKLAVIVGTLREVSVSEDFTTLEQATLTSTIRAGNGSNASITLKRPTDVNGKTVIRNIEVMDMSTFYKKANGFGKVDVAHADISGIATSFVDGDGNHDYSVIGGRFLSKFSKRGTNLRRRKARAV
jgi:hypothetical protein